eukprot:6461421-Lingulodinium_polyedra.AAC.1
MALCVRLVCIWYASAGVFSCLFCAGPRVAAGRVAAAIVSEMVSAGQAGRRLCAPAAAAIAALQRIASVGQQESS